MTQEERVRAVAATAMGVAHDGRVPDGCWHTVFTTVFYALMADGGTPVGATSGEIEETATERE